jgi:hypothetical protein
MVGWLTIYDERGTDTVRVEHSFRWLNGGAPIIGTLSFRDVTEIEVERRARGFIDDFFRLASQVGNDP